MPTKPDLTPWPALLEAAAKRWPDAPKFPVDLSDPNEPPGGLFMMLHDIDGMYRWIGGYAFESCLIRWATEFGAWWERQTGMRSAIVSPTPTGWWLEVWDNGRAIAGGKSFPTLLSAHAAAVGAIVGTP